MPKSQPETSVSIALLQPGELELSEEDALLKKNSQSRWKRSSLGRKWASVTRHTATWRFIVLSGLVVTLVILTLNLSLLIWSRVRLQAGNMLYVGDCGSAKTTATSWSLAINVLSTLLLGASNAAMQCLCAPTRAEVDKAHAAGAWLDIGVSGLRNWGAMGRWRKYAWGCILLSSLPLHLLYNSVIFSTSQANDYMVLLVTPDFLNGATPSLGPHDSLPIIGASASGASIEETISAANATQVAAALQSNISSLKRLENADCIQTYGTDFVTKSLNVLLVTNGTHLQAGSILAGYQYYAAPKSPSVEVVDILNMSWICHGLQGCSIPSQVSEASTWNFTVWGNDTVSGNGTVLGHETTRVSYCLSQPVLPQCIVEVFPQVLIIVIVCNILEAICFVTLLAKRDFTPLIVLGDAIASFMTDPDPTTLSSGPISAEYVRKAYLGDPLRFSTQHQNWQWRQNRPLRRTVQWHANRRRWALAVGPKRWSYTVLGFAALWFTGLAFLLHEQRTGLTIPFSTFWTQGFGSPNPLATLQLPKSFPVIALVLLANLPQVLLSLVYLVCNDVATCMLLSAEFVRYAHVHKGLRVTSPRGEQRGTYTLSLPLKMSIPLLAAAGVLHWAMSQSLFLAKVNVLDHSGDIDSDRSFSTLGWSALALLILLIVGGVMLGALVATGFRRFGPEAPTVGSNSRAMMAAAFAAGDGREEVRRRVRYGVVGWENGCGRVGFGSGEVGKLEDEELYA
ncbi:hypothetical protein MMC17_003668 [Xylographa soralifera]|nr:hypothetical protein [Xylographa soralifera]